VEKFYVHSEEFWGGTRQWAVFERLPWPNRWRRASRFYVTSAPADKMRDRMNADWNRYQAAMADKLTAQPACGDIQRHASAPHH
jgi:hypothetical protein